jgi:hypothetical protein
LTGTPTAPPRLYRKKGFKPLPYSSKVGAAANRIYRWRDSVLGTRRELRTALLGFDPEHDEEQPSPYRGKSAGNDRGVRVNGQIVSAQKLAPIKGITDVLALGGSDDNKPIFHNNTSTDYRDG